MNLKIINYHEPNGICGNLLNVIERLERRRKNELLYFKFNNILYSNNQNVWNKFFYQPFHEYEDLINKKIKLKQYTEEIFAHGRKNNWGYSFKNNLKDLHNKKRIRQLRKIKNNFIFVKKKILETVKIYENKYLKHKTLGVHIIGTDKFSSMGHDKFKNKKHLFDFNLHIRPQIDVKLDKNNLKKIFIATDEKKVQRDFKKIYKQKLLPMNSKLLSSRKNIGAHFINIYGSEEKKTYLGIEALADMLILSKCNYSLLSQSNLSLSSIIFRQDFNFYFLDAHIQ